MIIIVNAFAFEFDLISQLVPQMGYKYVQTELLI